MSTFNTIFVAAFLLLASSASQAVIFFDNNTVIDPNNTTWNDTDPTYTIFDDFTLGSDSVITDINYSMFTTSLSNYDNSVVSILNGFGGSEVISTFTITGTLTSNGLTTANSNVPNGFDVNLSGLNINLTAGNYVLGLSTDVVSGYASIGSGDSGYGSSLVQNTTQRNEHMAFSLEGNSNSVPEPSIIALMGLGLAGLSFARRRRTQA